jgi:hypothetical protein
MKSPSNAVLLVAGALLALSSAGASAQIRASERGAVSQTVDGTVIAIDYGRPKVRGRDNLFGGIVPWGKVWTPGANWATTIDVNRDITIDGHALAKGRYSVWMQVQPEEWTVILDPEPRRFHLMPPPPSAEQIRFTKKPAPTEYVETLTWSFPEARPTGTTMQMAWGTTAVTFDVGVSPSRPLTVPADLAARYVGEYRLRQTVPVEQTVAFTITYDGEHLVAHWESAPNPLLERPWLIHLGEGMFVPAELMDGELFDIVTDLVFEFAPSQGTATGFEMRALGDQLWGTAERIR